MTPFNPIETEACGILIQLLEPLKFETLGAQQPVRLVLAGDKGALTMLYDATMIEDAIDSNLEFPYQEFLSMLHKRIRNAIVNN